MWANSHLLSRPDTSVASARRLDLWQIKPADGSGLGMNINPDNVILGFTGAGTVAELAGVQVGPGRIVALHRRSSALHQIR
jgi:hypothetical protein